MCGRLFSEKKKESWKHLRIIWEGGEQWGLVSGQKCGIEWDNDSNNNDINKTTSNIHSIHRIHSTSIYGASVF